MLKYNDFIKNKQTIKTENKSAEKLNKEIIKKAGDEINSDIKIEDTKDYTIDKIVAISTEKPNMDGKVDLTSESYMDATPLTTDLNLKNVAKGDTLYITAVLTPKTTSAMYKPGRLGVLKVRVLDLYYDLNKLKFNTQYNKSEKPVKTKK